MSSPWPLPGLLEFEGEVPVFMLHTPSVASVKPVLDAMFVEVDVRLDAAGTLAYHVGIPDRGLPASTIAIPPEQLRRVARGAARMNVCPTSLVDPEGGRVDLSRFVMDVTHDWSGAYANAWQAFSAGSFEVAEALLAPVTKGDASPFAAARLLGRCLRSLGRLDEAIAQYRATLKLACNAKGTDLLPLASGALNDLGVAFKRSGDAPRTEIALLHALHLRPNYPQALLTLAATTLDPHLVLHAAARVLRIGGNGALVDALLGNVAQESGTKALEWRRRAEAGAETVDLQRWPLERRGLGTLAAVERDLDRGEMTFGPSPKDAWGDASIQPPK